MPQAPFCQQVHLKLRQVLVQLEFEVFIPDCGVNAQLIFANVAKNWAVPGSLVIYQVLYPGAASLSRFRPSLSADTCAADASAAARMPGIDGSSSSRAPSVTSGISKPVLSGRTELSKNGDIKKPA